MNYFFLPIYHILQKTLLFTFILFLGGYPALAASSISIQTGDNPPFVVNDSNKEGSIFLQNEDGSQEIRTPYRPPVQNNPNDTSLNINPQVYPPYFGNNKHPRPPHKKNFPHSKEPFNHSNHNKPNGYNKPHQRPNSKKNLSYPNDRINLNKQSKTNAMP